MPLCCIGGVCIPYTAVFPLLVLGLKWLLEKLVQFGVIPETWHTKIVALLQGRGLATSNRKSQTASGADKKRRKASNYSSRPTESTADSSTCCSDNGCNNNIKTTQNGSNGTSKTAAVVVRTVESKEEWDNIVSLHTLVVVKMTAAWCRPCKVIQPYFEELAAKYGQASHAFAIVDVDELDEVASQYSVAALPTFVAIDTLNSSIIARYSGSAEAKLLDFFETVQEHAKEQPQ